MEAQVATTRFISQAFSIMQPLVDGIVEHNCINTEGFESGDVQWHEASPSQYPFQLCQLKWRDVILLQVEMSMLGEPFNLMANWHALRH